MNSPTSARPPLASSASASGHNTAGAGPRDFPFPPFPSLPTDPIAIEAPDIQPLAYRISLLGAKTANAPVNESVELDKLKLLRDSASHLLGSHGSPAAAPTPGIQSALASSETWKIRWSCFLPVPPSLDSVGTSKENLRQQGPSNPYLLPGSSAAGHGYRKPSYSAATSATPTPIPFPHQSIMPLSERTTPNSQLNLKSGRNRQRADSTASPSARKRQKLGTPSAFSPAASKPPVHPLARFIDDMRQHGSSEYELLKTAREQFLSEEHNIDSISSRQGKLPLKLAYIDAERSTDTVVESKLWLFSLQTDQDMDVDLFQAPPGLELQMTGSFTHQDLFPSLYNDNSVYVPPANRPARNFGSCLQLSTATNLDAIKASIAFSQAVHDHILDNAVSSCRPRHVGMPRRCGNAVVWPALLSNARGMTLSYDLHYDFEGLVATANLHFCKDVPIEIDKTVCEADNRQETLTQDSRLLLCPTALEAIFMRYYGEESTTQPSKKQAQQESAEIPDLKQHFSSVMFGKKSKDKSDETGQIGDRWLLCRYADQEVVWPATFCLLRSRFSEEPLSDMTENKRHFRPSVSELSLQSYAHRMDHLANKTSNFIDKAAKDREKERRERAEKAIAASNATGTSMISSPTYFGSSPAFGASPQTQITNLTPGHSGIMSPSLSSKAAVPADISALAKSGSANLKSLQALPLAADDLKTLPHKIKKRKWPIFEGTPSLAALASLYPLVPPKHVPIEHAESDDNQLEPDATGVSKAAILYSTPQSAHTVGSLSAEQQTAPQDNAVAEVAAARGAIGTAVNETFDDFLWTSFPSADLSYVTGVGSNAAYDGVAGMSTNASMSFFDSGAGIFDAGLTEDDFSFYDTPALPTSTSLPDTAMQPQTTTDGPQHSLSTQSVTNNLAFQDPTAFITSTGPVDHFGHLMPTGESPASVSNPSITTPNFGSGESANAQSHLSLSPVIFRGTGVQSTTADSPSLAFMADFSASPIDGNFNRPNGYVVPSLSTISEMQALPQDDPTASYSPSLQANEPGRSIVSPKYTVKAADRLGLPIKDLTPYKLTYPTKYSAFSFNDTDKEFPTVSIVTSITTKDRSPSWESLITQYHSAKANALRQTLHMQNPKASLSESKLYRNWVSTPIGMVLPPIDSSSSSDSSDSEGEGLQDRRYFGSSRRGSYHSQNGRHILRPNLLVLMSLFEKHAPETIQVTEPEKPSADRTRLSKGEREALATVFFQQLLENADLRERLKTPHKQKESVGELETFAKILLPRIPFKLAWSTISLQPANISVYYHSAVMKMSALALPFWQKIGLKPHSGPKDVRAFAIAPSFFIDSDTKTAVTAWFQQLARTYQSCGLGNMRGLDSGIADTPSFLHVLESQGKPLSEVSNMQEKLLPIGAKISEETTSDTHTLIYIIVADEECHRPNSLIVQLCLRLHLLKRGVIPHLVPLSLMSRQALAAQRSDSFHRSELVRLAFNIYDRLPVTVQRHATKRLEQLQASPSTASIVPGQMSRVCPAPAFKIVPHSRTAINFTMQWPSASLDILDRHRLFHVSYSISADGKWLYLAAIDERAEFHSLRVRYIEGLEMKMVIKRIWNFAKEVTESVSVEWRINVAKCGNLAVPEIQAWSDLINACIPALTRPAIVTVTSIGAPDVFVLADLSGDSPPPASEKSALQTDFNYSDKRYAIRATYPKHPIPLYSTSTTADIHSTNRPRRLLYYSLASSTLYYAPKLSVSDKPTEQTREAQGFSVHLLLSMSHPASTYIQPISRHLQDITQSFVDLHVVAKERWSLSAKTGNLGHLPWHLAAVHYIANYDIESLFPEQK